MYSDKRSSLKRILVSGVQPDNYLVLIQNIGNQQFRCLIRKVKYFFSHKGFFVRWLQKWITITFAVANFIVPSQVFAQKTSEPQKAGDIVQEKQPIAAYWIKNLFFTRGLNIRNELWDRNGTGAFRSRWRFIYSNPLGPRFALQLEVPVDLTVPAEAKSVAGLGDINVLFQGAVTQHEVLKQIGGIRVFLPTGSHKLLGGDLTVINPRYEINYINYKYLFPSFYIRYFHSVIEQDDAPEVRTLVIDPFITFPQIAPHSVGLSASIELEWDFNFVADRNGGVMYFGISKQVNPQTVLHVEVSPGVNAYFRETAWEWRYDVDFLVTF